MKYELSENAAMVIKESLDVALKQGGLRAMPAIQLALHEMILSEKANAKALEDAKKEQEEKVKKELEKKVDAESDKESVQ